MAMATSAPYCEVAIRRTGQIVAERYRRTCSFRSDVIAIADTSSEFSPKIAAARNRDWTPASYEGTGKFCLGRQLWPRMVWASLSLKRNFIPYGGMAGKNMGRRSERLSKQGRLASDLAGEGDVIQVVSRAFDVLRCFEGHEARLGNLEISNRCGLPRSTVSRLTHTLTRMGQLVYLPRDQKYRIGPSAVAMSTSMMRGLQLRNLIRLRLQDVAEQLPGTVGFVIPDRFHLVYLEFARAANALGLHESTGSRIAMASTAAGHAYTAALDVDVGDALLAEMEREIPQGASLLRPRIEGNRRYLREHGYVVACGLWSPHINGLAVPMWSPQYQTFVVVTIGLLSAMFDEKRLHKEVAPHMLRLGVAVGSLLEGADGELFNNRLERKALPVTTHNNKIIKAEDSNELEAGARRPRSARSLRARDGRR
jgi:DNA-binding IclR family transcriptional regulator